MSVGPSQREELAYLLFLLSICTVIPGGLLFGDQLFDSSLSTRQAVTSATSMFAIAINIPTLLGWILFYAWPKSHPR